MATFLILAAILALFAVLLCDAGWNNVLSSARNEVVFDGRNRAYGAYPMRREHHRVMILAFGAAIGTIGAAVFLPKLFVSNATEIPLLADRTKEIVIDVIPIDHIQPDQRRTTITPPAREQNTGPLVPIDSIPEPIIDTTTHISDPSPGNTGTGTPIDSIGPNPGPPGGGGTGKGLPVDTIMIWTPNMPRYKGGQPALDAYLARAIRFDPDMLRGKQSVTLHVEFVIDVNGEVILPRIVNPFGRDLDGSVLRAMRDMPDWYPGSMNDQPVKVRLTQPVRFRVK